MIDKRGVARRSPLHWGIESRPMSDVPTLEILLDGWRGWMPPAELGAVLAAYAGRSWQIADSPNLPAGADPAYTLAGDALGLGDQRGLACALAGGYEATPCHWMAGRDHVLLQPALQPTPRETAALLASAREVLEGIELHCDDHACWAVRADFDLATPGPLGALGRNVGALLPMAQTPVAAKQFFNLLQMVWHDHPVNEARAQAGIAPINALWLCGQPKALAIGPTRPRAALMPTPGWRSRRLIDAAASGADQRLLWLESVREALLQGQTEITATARADLQLLGQVLAAVPGHQAVTVTVTGPDGARCIRSAAQPTGFGRLLTRLRRRSGVTMLLPHLFE
jgi:hypothetical protein